MAALDLPAGVTIDVLTGRNAVYKIFGEEADRRHVAQTLATKRRIFETGDPATPGFRHKILAFAQSMG